MRRLFGYALLLGCAALNVQTPPVWSDSASSVRLGERLLHGDLVGFSGVGQLIHTPHPGAILAAAALALLGHATALAAYGVLSGVAFAALVYFVYRLGAVLAGPFAGVLAAGIAALTPHVIFAARDTIDVPFTALVVAAVVAAVEDRRRAALIMLALAGTLRPEAWVLTFVLAIAWRDRPRWGALIAIAGPLMWLLFGLITTGDPLVALHTTQQFAQGRVSVPNPFAGMATMVTAPVVMAGVIGIALAAKRRSPSRLLVAGSAATLALATCAVAVIGRVEAFDRFFLAPAALVAVIAAVTTIEMIASLRPGHTRTGARQLHRASGPQSSPGLRTTSPSLSLVRRG